MAYFDSLANPYQGSASAFTSPGMDPKMMAMLMAMQNGQGQQGAQPGMMGGQPGMGAGGPPGQPPMLGAPPGMPPQGGPQQPQGQDGGILQKIMQMDPQMLRMAIMRMHQQGLQQPGM